MKQIQSPFALKKHALTVISTDLAEPEALIRKLADEVRLAEPEAFAGKRSCVYYKLPYIPPCEKFQELRRLTLRIREHTGLRANFHGIVALDATEWLGHEKEEYFTALLKYLFDHSACWHAALILKNCPDAKRNRFVRNICFTVPGIEPKVSDQMLFRDPEQLGAYCLDRVHEANRVIAQNGLSLLADTLMRKELSDVRSLCLIDQTVEDLIDSAPNRKIISAVNVRQYLSRPDTVLTMMLGAPALEERSGFIHESFL